MKEGIRAHVEFNLLCAGPAGAVEMIEHDRPDRRFIITPKAIGSGWRVTCIDQHGPYRHSEHTSREAALRSYSGESNRSEPAEGTWGQYFVKRVVKFSK